MITEETAVTLVMIMQPWHDLQKTAAEHISDETMSKVARCPLRTQQKPAPRNLCCD